MVVLFAFFFLASGHAESDKTAWRSKMNDLSYALSQAIPYLYPDPKTDPKVLNEKVKKIYDITKQLDGEMHGGVQMPDADPALPYIAGLLKSDIERAYSSLKEGHSEYAKMVLRSSVSYCIACHTRGGDGIEFPLLKAFKDPLKKASWIEKIEFQTASRQFDVVLSDVMGELQKPGLVGVSSLDLERGARIALSVAVRFKQDPKRASLLAQLVSKSPSATFSMKESAKVWLKDIDFWQKEKSKIYASDVDLINAAQELIKRDKDEPTLGDYSEVRYLRASVLMHHLLKQYPKSEHAGEALYVIGLAYDSLKELGLWSMHEMYYLTCIDKVPHTLQAEKCFKRYEESVTLGYSGSSGIHIPKAIRSHLNSVREKAKAKK